MAASPKPSLPPIIEFMGMNSIIATNSNRQYYYGFTIRYSGEQKKSYFLKEIERPDIRISVTVAVVQKRHSGSSYTTLEFTTKVIQTSSSALTQDEIRELEMELQSNTTFLRKYQSIDRADLAPDLVDKLTSLEARNGIIAPKLESEKKASSTVVHSFPVSPHQLKSKHKIKLFFDGFVITCLMREIQFGY